jgi:hypothetical protein
MNQLVNKTDIRPVSDLNGFLIRLLARWTDRMSLHLSAKMIGGFTSIGPNCLTVISRAGRNEHFRLFWKSILSLHHSPLAESVLFLIESGCISP